GRLYAFRDVTRENELDRMKSEFVSMVSHELRTPLTSIRGYVSLLLDGNLGPLADEQGASLKLVMKNADRLLDLITDILDLARLESGRLELRRSPVDLAELVREVGASLQPQLAAKRQTL